MKVIVIGLGSMGKRRIRLIKQYDENIEIIGVDTNALRCQEVQETFGIETFEELQQALVLHPDCAFVTTSPVTHVSIIKCCLENNMHVFTELNLVSDGYEENQKLAQNRGRVLFLSSTMLYRRETEYIANRVREQKQLLHYQYHIGQYLPDWHPWENYKSFFIGDRRTNGCRELFAIELPWLERTFGEIEEIKVIKSKLTSLDIDYPDCFAVIIKHAAGHVGTLNINVVSRKAVREFKLIGEQIYLSWNGTPNSLQEYCIEKNADIPINLYETIDKLSGYSENIIENAYLCEIEEFFMTIAGKVVPRYSFSKDTEILQAIDKIEGK